MDPAGWICVGVGSCASCQAKDKADIVVTKSIGAKDSLIIGPNISKSHNHVKKFHIVWPDSWTVVCTAFHLDHESEE